MTRNRSNDIEFIKFNMELYDKKDAIYRCSVDAIVSKFVNLMMHRKN